MAQFDESVKDYFKASGTVVKWWDPEAGRDLFAQDLRRQIEIIEQKVKAGDSVVDVATGQGRLAINLRGHGFKEVVAADISRDMLRVLKGRADAMSLSPPIEAVDLDAEQLPFKAASFDVVACLEALVHIPHTGQALSEFRRILRAEGVLVVSVTLPIHTSTWLKHVRRVNSLHKLAEWIFTPIYNSRAYQDYVRPVLGRRRRVGREISEPYLNENLAASGFRVEERFPLDAARNPRHLLVFARKTPEAAG